MGGTMSPRDKTPPGKTTRSKAPRVSTVFLAAAAGCFMLGAGVTVADVVLRAVAGRNVPAAIETTSLLIGLGALLSIPVSYAMRTHVTARLLSEMAPGRFARPLGRFGALMQLLFAGVLCAIMAVNLWQKWASPERTPDLNLPMPPLWAVVALTFLAALVAALAGLVLEWRRHGHDG
ncbi:TRAP transporter small permease [Acidimangrovimonas sediminis]|uniref:TRAP transporter small permease n=1 Tax=Acidimangrovimonas sediminis TaxID=2056283 RepID=UPI001E5E0DE7|nr:TRAP transporter small permease [Acidimangrovimonas sediminis]